MNAYDRATTAALIAITLAWGALITYGLTTL